jgi:hypothetical protein
MRILIVFLLAFAIDTNSQIITQPNTGTNKIDSKEKERQEDPKNTPKDGTCIGCIVAQPNHKTQQQQDTEDANNRLYYWYMLATIIGVVGGFIGIIVLICQNKITRRTADAAKASAEHTINIARPWFFEIIDPIPSREVNPPGNIPERYGFKWSVKNYGQTPGWIVEIDGGFEKFRTLYEIPRPPSSREVYRGKFFVIPPGESTPIFTASKSITSQETLMEDDFLFYAYAIVKYRDAFSDDIHETGFCYVYDKRDGQLVKSEEPAYYNKHT